MPNWLLSRRHFSSRMSGRAAIRSVHRRKSWLRLALVAVLGGLLSGDSIWWDRRAPQSATEIFEGVTYGSARLEITPEGGGLLHWLRIDLSAPGIELYVTPLDPAAVAQGWQYRLRPIKEVIASEGLAVAINGTLFTWDGPRWLPRSGDLARAVETVVADHVVSHVWEHSYLLWFDGQLTPHLRAAKPPQPSELAMARWGIGGQGVGLQHGQVWPGSSRDPDARTAVAIDQARKLLFLAVAENMSPRRLLQELADLGGKEGMLLDGGDSSALAIGEGSQAIAPGILYGGWRPVATYFGVRARPVRKKADD